MSTEQDQQLLLQQQQQWHPQPSPADSIWNIVSGESPSTPHLMTLLVLVPLGATLLLLAGLTLAATVVGLLIAVPLLLLFSPIIVPAVFSIVLAVLGILTSEAFGVTGVASVLWLANYVRAVGPWQEAASYLGLKIEHKASEEGKAQKVVKAHEAART